MREKIIYGQIEDLAHNRAGRVSPRQGDISARPLRWAAVSVGLASGFAVLLGIVLPVLAQVPPTTRLLAWGFSALVILGDAVGVAVILRAARRAAAQPVTMVEGVLEHLPRNYAGELSTQMQIGGRTVSVPKPQLPLEVGRRYRVYGVEMPKRHMIMTYTLVELEEQL